MGSEEHLKKGATSSRPSLFCGDKPRVWWWNMAAATSLALRAPGVRSAPGEGSVLWCKQVQLTEEHLKKGATSSRPSLFCGDKPRVWWGTIEEVWYRHDCVPGHPRWRKDRDYSCNKVKERIKQYKKFIYYNRFSSSNLARRTSLEGLIVLREHSICTGSGVTWRRQMNKGSIGKWDKAWRQKRKEEGKKLKGKKKISSRAAISAVPTHHECLKTKTCLKTKKKEKENEETIKKKLVVSLFWHR